MTSDTNELTIFAMPAYTLQLPLTPVTSQAATNQPVYESTKRIEFCYARKLCYYYPFLSADYLKYHPLICGCYTRYSVEEERISNE